MSNLDTFAQRVKALRIEKCVKQQEIAEFMGIGLRAYQYYEGAVHYPDVPGLMKLSAFFGVSMDYLLGRSEERQIKNTNNLCVLKISARVTLKFQERLKTLREAKDLRQADLAKSMGVSMRTYQYYESGERQPDYETLVALADFFDVSADYLLGRSDKRE